MTARMHDPVTKLIMKAGHRYNNAERRVTSLAGELRDQSDPGRLEQFKALLAERTAERDAAFKRWQQLQNTPRWLLEKELAETS